MSARGLAWARLLAACPFLLAVSLQGQSLAIGGAGAWNAPLTVTPASGSAWPAAITGTPAWVSVSGQPGAGTGSGTVRLNVLANNSGVSRSATLKFAGAGTAQITVTQAAYVYPCASVFVDDGNGGYYDTYCYGTPKAAGTLSISGTSASRTFTTNAVDLNSDPYITEEIDIGYATQADSSTLSRNRCTIIWTPYAGTISVTDPIHGTQTGAIGGGGTIGNVEWCVIDLGAVTAVASDSGGTAGQQLAAAIPVTFGTGLAGTLTVYRTGSDAYGWDFGAVAGTITAYAALPDAPTITSATTAVVNVNEATYTVTAHDPNGWMYLTKVSVGLALPAGSFTVPTGLNFINCLFQYDVTTGVLTPVGNTSYQCAVKSWTVAGSGKDLTITLDLTFLGSLVNKAGALFVWGNVQNRGNSAPTYGLAYPALSLSVGPFSVPAGTSRAQSATITSNSALLTGTPVLTSSGFPSGISFSMTAVPLSGNASSPYVTVATGTSPGTYNGTVTASIGGAAVTI